MEDLEVFVRPRNAGTKDECTNCGKKSTKEAFCGEERIAFCDNKNCEKVAIERARVMGN